MYLTTPAPNAEVAPSKNVTKKSSIFPRADDPKIPKMKPTVICILYDISEAESIMCCKVIL